MMKEQISNLRRLITSNRVAVALEELLTLAESEDKYEPLIDDIILLQSTNAPLLKEEVASANTPDYRQLVKEVLALLGHFKPPSQTPTFPQTETTGRNISLLQPNILKEEDKNLPKIAFLIPNPIDKELKFNFEDVHKPFKQSKVWIDCFYLSLETLQNLDGYDYLIIYSQVFKDKIYIEGENLQSQVIRIKDLEDNILSKVKTLLLVAEGEVSLTGITTPFIHLKAIKALDNLVFKFFKQGDLDKLQGESLAFANKEAIQPIRLDKGTSQINLPTCDLPTEMDKKILQNFVGRTLDQEKLIEKIIALRYSERVLTLKGAGGIGKTTILSKVVIELKQRGFFNEGIAFIPCEYLTDYKAFEAKVAIAFAFDNIINFTEHIRLYKRFDKIIILDNFETLLNLAEAADVEEIKNLVKLISDYASIVITSREALNFDFEDVFPLDRLATDDALKLFLTTAKMEIKNPNEIRILREDVIENLLANNPLAIKIIASPTVLPKGKDMRKLKEELESDFFSATSIELSDVFRSDVDMNVERKRSVYQSINYSYSKLNLTDKLAFELLHLFPDGINMTRFENCFSYKNKKQAETKVKEANLASLDNKSLVELSQGNVKLQSIIGRFAAYQFEKREKKEKAMYYEDAYNYNAFMLKRSDNVNYRKNYDEALKIADKYIHNLLYALTYIPQLKYNQGQKVFLLNYIDDIVAYITTNSALSKYIQALGQEKFYPYFSEVNNATLLLEIAKIGLSYHQLTFDAHYQELTRILPITDIYKLKIEGEVEPIFIIRALRIYSYEGYTLECIKLLNHHFLYNWGINDMLFYLGDYRYINAKSEDFYAYELLLNQQKLQIKELEKRIEDCFHRNHLDKMQMTYTLSKVKKLERQYIEKLVITNPYTRGLKNLMFAFNAEEDSQKRRYYEEAIQYLEHIKYYYIEAIYFYAKYLQTQNSADYKTQFEKGYELASKYQYRFLVHQFRQLQQGTNETYQPADSPLLVDFEYEEFVKEYAKEGGFEYVAETQQEVEVSVSRQPITNKPPQKPILFVEGPTDKTALEIAIELFAPYLAATLEIQSEYDERPYSANPSQKGGGYNWVKSRMKGWIVNKWKIKAACLLDKDPDAIEASQAIKQEISQLNNAELQKYYRVFQLEKAAHILPLYKQNLVLPFALEEMFPIQCWEYANSQNWLEERELSEIVQKAKGFDPNQHTIPSYLETLVLSDNLYLTKQVKKEYKKDFILYISKLSQKEKELVFEEFRELIKKLSIFFC